MTPECPICMDPLDDDDRRAFNFCPQGHTFCRDCITTLMDSRYDSTKESNDCLYFKIPSELRWAGYTVKCPTCRFDKPTSPGHTVTFNRIPIRLLQHDVAKPKFSGIGVEEREKLSCQLTDNVHTVEQQIGSLIEALKVQKSMLKDFQQSEQRQIEHLASEVDSKTKELSALEEKKQKLEEQIIKADEEYRQRVEVLETEYLRISRRLKADIEDLGQKMAQLEARADARIKEKEEATERCIKEKEEEAERCIQENKETLQAEMYRIARLNSRKELDDARKEMEEEIAELYAKQKAEIDFQKQQTEEQLRQDQIQVGASIKARLENLETEINLRRKQVEDEIKEDRERQTEELKKWIDEMKKKIRGDLAEFGQTIEKFRAFDSLHRSCRERRSYFSKESGRMITKDGVNVGTDELMLWSMLQYFLSGRKMVLSLDEFFKHRHEQMKNKEKKKHWQEFTPHSFFFKEIRRIQNQ
jgi:hypothetical protein